MKYSVDLSKEDMQVILKALSYLCVATHSRTMYLHSHSLEEKFKNIINDFEKE